MKVSVATGWEGQSVFLYPLVRIPAPSGGSPDVPITTIRYHFSKGSCIFPRVSVQWGAWYRSSQEPTRAYPCNHFNRLLSIRRRSGSIQTVKLLTLSWRVSPETLWRNLISAIMSSFFCTLPIVCDHRWEKGCKQGTSSANWVSDAPPQAGTAPVTLLPLNQSHRLFFHHLWPRS